MPEWLVILIYLVGVAHALPAWFYGKAAGIRLARTIIYGEEQS